MNKIQGPEVIDLVSPPGSDPEDILVEEPEKRHTSCPKRNRYHPYQSLRIGDKRAYIASCRPESTSSLARGSSGYMNGLFATPASQPLDADSPSIIFDGVVNQSFHGRPIGLDSTPPLTQDLQRPRAQPPLASQRTDFSSAKAAETTKTRSTGCTPSVTASNNHSPHNVSTERAAFTTVSSTHRQRNGPDSPNRQSVKLNPIQASHFQEVLKTDSVAIQTTHDASSNENINGEQATVIHAVSNPREACETNPIEKLISEVTSAFAEHIRGRCTKNFKVTDESDQKILTKALNKAKEGIKPYRSSFREIMELFSVIDATHFPYEVDRFWNKDVVKVACREKEEKLRAMVKDLNEIEKRLVELDAKIKTKSITEAEQAEFDSYATELAKKYFKYQKFLGTECQIRSHMYATQTQKFDFGQSKISALPAVQQALEETEESLNAEREKFLKCKADLDSVSLPLFSQVEEIVSRAMNPTHSDDIEAQIFITAEQVYNELVKETKYRRMNDFWRGLLEIIRCPSMEDLERSDPANKHPALASRLDINAAGTRQRLQEFLTDATPRENNDDVDVEQTLGGEDSVNLEDVVMDADDEGEETVNLNISDAVVPTNSATSFTLFFEEMQQSRR